MTLDVTQHIFQEFLLNSVGSVKLRLLGSIRINHNPVCDQLLNFSLVTPGNISDAKPSLSLNHLFILSLLPPLGDPLGPLPETHSLSQVLHVTVPLSSLHNL